LERVCQIGNAVFGLRVGETVPMGPAGLAARSAAMLQGYPAAAPGAVPPAWLDIVATETLTLVREGTAPIAVGTDEIDALNHVILALLRLAYPHEVPLGTFHAAAVGQQQTILLSGVSGAGKSTLAAHLASEGWRYYGDDIVGLSSGGWVLPMPSAVSLKEGSWPVLRQAYPELDTLGTVHYHNKEARFLPVPSAADAETAARTVRAWVFSRYQPGATIQFEPIETIEALQSLIIGGFALSTGIDQAGVGVLLDLLTRAPKYRLVYGTLDEATTCLRSLLPH
jgi:hypothetical protein